MSILEISLTLLDKKLKQVKSEGLQNLEYKFSQTNPYRYQVTPSNIQRMTTLFWYQREHFVV